MQADINVGANGHFRFTKYKGDIVTEERESSNLILQGGLTRMFELMRSSSNSWALAQYLFFGKSDIEPTRGDPGLRDPDPRDGKRYNSYELRTFNDPQNLLKWTEASLRYSFNVGELTGTWNEVGTRSSSGITEGYAFNRALIRDINGVPNPLVIEADEALEVEFTFRLTLGLQTAQQGSFFLSLDRERISYSLKPLDSDYWSSSNSKNILSQGLPIEHIVVLDESLSPLSFNTGPWPNSPVNRNVSPSISRNYNVNGRFMRFDITIRDGEEDAYIGGFAFGPSTSSTDWMFLIELDEPLLKPAFNTVTMSIVASLNVSYPESPWDS